MGIGTSLGAYYESDFDHQAGVEVPIVKPKDTGDDNVLPPDTEDKAAGIKITPVSDVKRMDEPLKRVIPDFTNERPHDFIERGFIDTFKSAHNVMSGKVPMWAFDINSGEFHTSPEGINEGIGLAGLSLGNGWLPARIHLHPEATQALQEGPDVFQQFMAGRGRRQESNIVEAPQEILPRDQRANPNSPRGTWTPAEQPRIEGDRAIWEPQFEQIPWEGEPAFEPHYPVVDQTNYRTLHNRIHPDAMTDEQFLRWGEYQPYGHGNPMTEAQNQRWHDLNSRDPYNASGTEFDLHETYNHNYVEELRQDTFSRNAQRIEGIKKQFESNPDKVSKKGPISLMKDPEINHGLTTGHHFNFLSEGGIPGELSLRERNGGKNLYVSWIGKVGGMGPNEIGRTEMASLFRLLAEQFPKAEEISGFRVSGARGNANRPNDASMRIPGRGAPRRPEPRRKTIDELRTLPEMNNLQNITDIP